MESVVDHALWHNRASSQKELQNSKHAICEKAIGCSKKPLGCSPCTTANDARRCSQEGIYFGKLHHKRAKDSQKTPVSRCQHGSKMIPTTPPKIPTLYHVPYFCSSIPYQAVLELGIPSTELSVETITRETLRTDPRIVPFSPRRVAPFLRLPSGETMLEAGAILLYICERFDDAGLLHRPPGHAGRAAFLQGLFYGVSECYRASDAVLMECLGRDGRERDRGVVDEAKRRFEDVVVAHVVSEVGGGYYGGNKFSAVDTVLSYVLMCAEFCDEGLLRDEVVREYYERLKSRSSFKFLYSNPFSW